LLGIGPEKPHLLCGWQLVVASIFVKDGHAARRTRVMALVDPLIKTVLVVDVLVMALQLRYPVFWLKVQQANGTS
jgi:hypothetical protein